jgi:Protein of unknown function (DUF1064)
VRAHRSRRRQIEYDSHKFDNSQEVERYQYLMLRYRAGEITKPEVHPQYEITINGIIVGTYKPDFRYSERRGLMDAGDSESWQEIIEDCKPGYNKRKASKRKGVVIREWTERAMIDDPFWKFKKKIVEAALGIHITEIWK